MSKREPTLLLTDICESIEKIKIYTLELTYQQFVDDSKTIDAVIRNFEIIGEAANRLPEEIKDKFPEINWFRLRGFRNRIVHDYMGIDYEIVWNIIKNDLEKLLTDIKEIIEKLWKTIVRSPKIQNIKKLTISISCFKKSLKQMPTLTDRHFLLKSVIF